MRCIGVKALKNTLSEILRLVAAGETVLVTDRDRVIAELVPPRDGRSPLGSDAVLAEAVRKGWISPAVLTSDRPPPRLPVGPLEEILREIDGDRADR